MAAWRGAIDYRGFPVNVAFYSQKKSTRGPGFKVVGPDGQPPVNKAFEASSGRQLSSPEMGKAVLIGKGKAAVLHSVSPEAVEQIASGEKTQVMEASYYCPVETLPLELALMPYTVLPDPDVAGSDRSTTLLFNGLRATKLAYVTQATITSRDAVIAVYATDSELKAVSLPFVSELYPSHDYGWEVDQAMGNVFAQSLDQMIDEGMTEVKAFELTGFSSQYEARRNEIIDQVIAGNVVTSTTAEKPKQGLDLMAMLQASLEKPTKKPAKKAPVKKVKVS